MLSVVDRRRRRLCGQLLDTADAIVGFADVGSGGALKRPWSILPAARLRKFDFEPTRSARNGLPLCVSNREGEAAFHVARDERASSFHRALPHFVARYGMQTLLEARAITVQCVTLDRYFAEMIDAVDALDVNVEGHDFQVLEGGKRLLHEGNLKLLKIEFELAGVWEGQGWLSDIDPLLRTHGYELAGIDIDFARPLRVARCFHRGEPLWGKALYVPCLARWREMLSGQRTDGRAVWRTVAKGIALYIAADLPGRALDVLDLPTGRAAATDADLESRIRAVYRWAKLERGVAELWSLTTRALGMRGALI